VPEREREREVKEKVKGKGKNPTFLKIPQKQQDQLNNLTKKLLPIFPNIVHFRNEKLNMGINPDTMIHAFEKALKKRGFDNNRGGIEAYVAKTIIIEDGNFNEQAHIDEHNKIKNLKAPSLIRKTTQGIG
jgi:uncharacterized protein YdhG (YjbR/CyaY superfamily)